MLLIKDLNFNSIYKIQKTIRSNKYLEDFYTQYQQERNSFIISFQRVFIKKTQDIELIERLKIAIVVSLKKWIRGINN
ncbi:unnamed protein product [Paramecium pentaurelia]|uniref:Uncharacterized protein n=1 Tax=Paramecium pentaurelia TaxID=43138 RepID=A0A8S1TAD4_9CILI|nr:unnamed protein product [Paramecium pentaurelia]